MKNNEFGYSSFTLSPKRCIDRTNAKGIYSKGGKYSIGTFAHPDIAFEFASWLSPTFNSNAEFIKLGLSQKERLIRLNDSARNQMEILKNNDGIKN